MLHQAEYSLLSQLSGQVLDAQKHLEKGVEPISPIVTSLRQQLFNELVSYACQKAKLLILFAKTNADAAHRILDKLNRVRSIEGSSERLGLPNFDFFTHNSASSTLDFVKNRPLFCLEASTSDERINEKDFHEVLEPFLYKVKADQHDYKSQQKQNISLVIELLGFYRRLRKIEPHSSLTNGSTANGSTSDTFDDMLCSIIETQAAEVEPGLLFRIDDCGRSPLHYAAEHGLHNVITALQELSNIPSPVINSFIKPNEPEKRQISPLVIYICSGNNQAASRMMKMDSSNDAGDTQLPSHIVRIALEAGHVDVLESVLGLGTDINELDDQGQTLLCTAARRMPDACRLLLEQGAEVNLVEPSTGRTALCLASIRGDASLVHLLLKYGADAKIPDSRGWLPIEHAAYRGHFKPLMILASLDGFDASADLQTGSLHTAPLVQTDRTKESHIPWIHGLPEAFKGNYVWIRLGNNDATNPLKALQVEDTQLPNKLSSYADEVPYTLSLSVLGKPYIVKEWTLPVLESSVNKPWFFETDAIDDLKLVWQLYTYSNADTNTKKLVGSGIALMGSLNKGSRQNRESVVRDTTVPLLEPNASTYVGSITFTYFWSKPHPPPPRLRKPHSWEFGNGIGGHRGSGKNMIKDKKLQIGENTAQSFTTAISHGASFLEFDVQLTKDLVPVVYHDFLISETGTDSTMHTLTYDQFKTISSVQGPRRVRGSRSNSLQSADYGYLETFQERMDQTHFNKVNGFKANTRGTFIHERTCSLDELFRHVPTSVPLNIELKYPMLFETEEWDMELLAIKTDIFVDTILDKVYEHVEGRNIVFSSFSPEICIALSTKQRSLPVFFLSKTAAPRGEVRSCCIQQAVHFAKSWGLPGIVAECTIFNTCPRLIEYVKSAGLTVTSFGVGNSDKEKVKVSPCPFLTQ